MDSAVSSIDQKKSRGMPELTGVGGGRGTMVRKHAFYRIAGAG